MIPKYNGARSSAEEDTQNRSENMQSLIVDAIFPVRTGIASLGWQGVSEEYFAQIVARFWSKVNRTSGCWLWTASTNRGYGQFTLRINGRQSLIKSHRFSYQISHGIIPDGHGVLHTCDEPLCVRPSHLFAGTQAENLIDARQKGRLVCGRHLVKVSDAGLLDILTNYRPRKNGNQLAAKYGISLVHLLRIVNGTARVRRTMLEPVPFVHLPVRGEVA